MAAYLRDDDWLSLVQANCKFLLPTASNLYASSADVTFISRSPAMQQDTLKRIIHSVYTEKIM